MKHLLLACAFGLSLPACSTVNKGALLQDVRDATLAIPADWRVPDDGAATRAASWSALFNDPILATYLQTAEEQSLTFEQARLRVDQSEARLRVAKSRSLPFLSASVGATGSGFLDSLDLATDRFSNGLTARYDPDLFGERKASIRQSAANRDLAIANAQASRQSVMAAVARAYIRVIEADLQLALAQSNLTFLEETFRISKARFEVGDIGGDNLALSELEYQSSLSNFRSQELAVRETRRALSVVLGGYAQDDLNVAEQLPTPVGLPAGGMPATVLARRPDVRAAVYRLASSRANISRVAAGDWPSLSMTGSLSGGGNIIDDLFRPGDFVASLGASLLGTVFDNGAQSASEDEAYAGYAIDLAAYEATLRAGQTEIVSAYDRDAVLRETLTALDAASKAADEALRLEQIKFDLGESTLLDVLTVQRRVNAIQSSRITTNRSRLDAQILAFLATGGDLRDE